MAPEGLFPLPHEGRLAGGGGRLLLGQGKRAPSESDAFPPGRDRPGGDQNDPDPFVSKDPDLAGDPGKGAAGKSSVRARQDIAPDLDHEDPKPFFDFGASFPAGLGHQRPGRAPSSGARRASPARRRSRAFRISGIPSPVWEERR